VAAWVMGVDGATTIEACATPHGLAPY